jgi:hypothetical protein
MTKQFMLYFCIMCYDAYYHHAKFERNITLMYGEIKKDKMY